MSDMMLRGVLLLPYEVAMGDAVSRLQYWHRGQQAAKEIERLLADNSFMQARIDDLMQEYCPESITPEQWANIEANTRRVDADTEATISEALKGNAMRKEQE